MGPDLTGSESFCASREPSAEGEVPGAQPNDIPTKREGPFSAPPWVSALLPQMLLPSKSSMLGPQRTKRNVWV